MITLEQLAAEQLAKQKPVSEIDTTTLVEGNGRVIHLPRPLFGATMVVRGTATIIGPDNLMANIGAGEVVKFVVEDGRWITSRRTPAPVVHPENYFIVRLPDMAAGADVVVSGPCSIADVDDPATGRQLCLQGGQEASLMSDGGHWRIVRLTMGHIRRLSPEISPRVNGEWLLTNGRRFGEETTHEWCERLAQEHAAQQQLEAGVRGPRWYMQLAEFFQPVS